MSKRLWGIGQGPSGWYVKYCLGETAPVCYGPYRSEAYAGLGKRAIEAKAGLTEVKFVVAVIDHDPRKD